MKTGPLVRNMKAIFGTLLNGYVGTRGTAIEALQSNSSSFMSCIAFGGFRNSSNPIRVIVELGFSGSTFGIIIWEAEDDDDDKEN